MKIRLLRKVMEHIKTEPRRFDMSRWQYSSKEAPCGTQACIAGWACILDGRTEQGSEHGYLFPKGGEGWQKEGAKALGLTDAQGDRLFYATNWPRPFRRSFANSRKPESQVKIALKRIEHFIKTKGKE